MIYSLAFSNNISYNYFNALNFKKLKRQRDNVQKGKIKMAVKILLLVLFFGIMIAVGFYSRRHATNVNDFLPERRARRILTLSPTRSRKPPCSR